MTAELRLACVMLAAGRSSRMTAGHKLTTTWRGEPLIRHSLRAALDAALADIVVVTGCNAEAVEAALDGMPVRIVQNASFAEGMGSSIRTGIAALHGVEGAFIALGDMPLVTAGDYRSLTESFAGHPAPGICVPVHEGRRGHPVLFPSILFPELRALEGDTGASGVLRRHVALITEVPVSGPGVLIDFDTVEDFAVIT